MPKSTLFLRILQSNAFLYACAQRITCTKPHPSNSAFSIVSH
ncbi:hypothetical protein VP434O481_P0048 [Vibrio phage 434O48-1]|nr:hypothetical protein VP434O481_P0048 [Vibrio phage 434O48-1]